MTTPKVCDGCLKWEQFGKNCWVYWEDKKECTHKVENADQMALQNQLMTR